MYRPLQIKSGSKIGQQTSFMAKGGVNLRDLPQLLSLENALTIENYYITADGGLKKREGWVSQASTGGVEPGLMIEEFLDNLFFIAYSDKLAIFNKSTNTINTVHTYSSPSDIYNGRRYGDYFLITNNTEKIGRVSQTLAYDAQTGDFTVGDTVTGGTSGATAIILEDSDSGATGTLTLGNISGTFQDNEIITDKTSGSATVNGTKSWAYSTISAAPICRNLHVQGGRLYAIGIKDDEAAVKYSAKDDGTNPPFETWAIGPNADDPGEIAFRNAGRANTAISLGNNTVILAEKGKWAFYIDTIDSAGTLTKIDRTVIDRQDFGGSRAATITPRGVFYVNEAGLWNLVSIGQPNISYSDQEEETDLLLGNDFFDDIDLSNADLVYDSKRKLVILTCAQNSTINNFVVVYNTEFKAFTFFTGWNINRFARQDDEIYAVLANSTEVVKLFDGYKDGNNVIFTKFKQEIQLGGLNTKKSLQKFYIQGFLSPSTELQIYFDIYDEDGELITSKKSGTWTSDSVASGASVEGFGRASFGNSGWGDASGRSGSASTVESFAGFAPKISNFNRLLIRIEGEDDLEHIINWFSLIIYEKATIRKRNISLN